jgi:hypothetical protein
MTRYPKRHKMTPPMHPGQILWAASPTLSPSAGKTSSRIQAHKAA